MKLDSIFVPDTDEIVDIRNYTSSDNKGAQAHDLKEPPTVEDDPVEFRSKLVASWFVRSGNGFYCVEDLGAKLTQRDVKRISLRRFATRFPDETQDEGVWRDVFHRAIEETHDDPEQTIPIWNGKTRCRPNHSKATIDDGEMVSVNTWSAPTYRKLSVEDEDTKLFDELLERIFKQVVDRVIFKDWLSWCLQHEDDMLISIQK